MEIRIEKIKSFTDLSAWQEGHQLILLIFKVVRNFPQEDQSGLSSQLKRSALAITTNIAEGFGRTAFREKVQFYTFSLKAVREIQNYLLVARDLGYLKPDSFDKIASQTALVSKEIGKLVKGGKR
ncbi:MAG TPA: four helix bundle protein [Candidatus Paceibacterota bacterium]|nr:four helix bundle protein [Candidatus Paceibacterota bacterium]